MRVWFVESLQTFMSPSTQELRAGWHEGIILRQLAVVIGGVHLEREGGLLEIIQASDAFAPGLRSGERRQEQGRQDGNDGNHQQQFDQVNAPPGQHPPLPRRPGRVAGCGTRAFVG